MSSNLYTELTRLVHYIEIQIENALSLDELSSYSNLSKFHLTRVFKNITNLTLMEYVRERKLSRSIHDLLYTESSILEIALKYHFDYEQTYIRAFKKKFNITPSKFRKSNIPLPIVEKMNFNTIHRMSTGMLIKPKYLYRPSFILIGKNERITDQDNYEHDEANKRARAFFFEYRQRLDNLVNPNVYIGLTTWISNDAPYSDYMPALEISTHSSHALLNTIVIPSSKYLVFKYVGDHAAEEITVERVNELYGYIFGTFLPETGYDFMQEGAYHFEEIDYKISSDHYCEANIYFPIKS